MRDGHLFRGTTCGSYLKLVQRAGKTTITLLKLGQKQNKDVKPTSMNGRPPQMCVIARLALW
jgi:hypothetical protein